MPDMPIPSPDLGEYSPEKLRVIALAAAVEATNTYEMHPTKVSDEVLQVARKFNVWLEGGN